MSKPPKKTPAPCAFERGDIVALRSGGPHLTVKARRRDGEAALCVWFNGSDKQQDWFPVEMIEKVDKETAP